MAFPFTAQGQSPGYGSTYQFRDATSVGFAPEVRAAGWYPYGHYRFAPSGEFGGYLYRSPDDYVNFRGPVYQVIAGPAVGIPTSGADGRVQFGDVPLWTDEWAAQIVRNRNAAGISAHDPARTRPVPTAPAIKPPANSDRAPMTPAPRSQTPIRPMRPVPSDLNSPALPQESQPPVTKPIKKPLPPIVSSNPRAESPATDVPDEAMTAIDEPVVAVTPDRVEAPTTELDVLVLDSSGEEPAQVASSESAIDEVIASAANAPAVAASVPDTNPGEAIHRATAAGISIGRGDMAFEQGDYQQARVEYEDALSVTGEEPGVRIALGLAAYALGSFDDAAAAIRRGVARSPEIAASNFQLNDVYGRTEDLISHQQALYDHVDENPEDSEALFLLGFVQYFSGDPAAAKNTLGAYRSIVAHDEMADAFIEIVMGAGE